MSNWNPMMYLHFHSQKSRRVCQSSVNVAKRGRDIWSSQTANQTQYVNGIKSMQWIVGGKVEWKAKYIIILIFPISLADIIISAGRWYYGVMSLGGWGACLDILLLL